MKQISNFILNDDDDDAEMMSDRLNDYEQKCRVNESDRVNE